MGPGRRRTAAAHRLRPAGVLCWRRLPPASPCMLRRAAAVVPPHRWAHWPALQVMLNAREVTFPTRPAVSPECKEFIRRWGSRAPPDCVLRACAGMDERRGELAEPALPPIAISLFICDRTVGKHRPGPHLPFTATLCPAPWLPQVPGIPTGGQDGRARGSRPPLHVFQKGAQGHCSSQGGGGGGGQGGSGSGSHGKLGAAGEQPGPAASQRIGRLREAESPFDRNIDLLRFLLYTPHPQSSPLQNHFLYALDIFCSITLAST